VKRRLLLSYVALTALILVLLEVPLAGLYARRERDSLTAVARRDAAVLAVVAGESLEHPEEHDLQTLAVRYRAETGAEVAVTDAAGRTLVALDPGDPGGGGPDFETAVAAARLGHSHVGAHADDDGPETAVVIPVRGSSGLLGVVVVAVSARPTEARIHRVWLALAGFAVFLLGVAALLGLWLARGLSRPLLALETASGRLGDGDLSARVPLDGPAELKALASQFNRTADRLGELVAAQQQFVADASHQLRTPLTALRLRLENLAAELPDAVGGQLEDAQGEVERLTRLVDGLLALSRAQATMPPPSAVDITDVVVERCAAWAALADEQDVELTVSVRTTDAVQATVVPGHLEQILDNLLANAVEASPPGHGIEVGIEVGNEGRSDAGVEARVDGSYALVAVHVRDHGPGLSDRDRQRAFDRFWQGGTSPTGTSGLGLAIVRQLATANGGTITLEAPDGGGLDAVLCLPAAARP
jgi:signal transduction histidine kinase